MSLLLLSVHLCIHLPDSLLLSVFFSYVNLLKFAQTVSGKVGLERDLNDFSRLGI